MGNLLSNYLVYKNNINSKSPLKSWWHILLREKFMLAQRVIKTLGQSLVGKHVKTKVQNSRYLKYLTHSTGVLSNMISLCIVSLREKQQVQKESKRVRHTSFWKKK